MGWWTLVFGEELEGFGKRRITEYGHEDQCTDSTHTLPLTPPNPPPHNKLSNKIPQKHNNLHNKNQQIIEPDLRPILSITQRDILPVYLGGRGGLLCDDYVPVAEDDLAEGGLDFVLCEEF